MEGMTLCIMRLGHESHGPPPFDHATLAVPRQNVHCTLSIRIQILRLH